MKQFAATLAMPYPGDSEACGEALGRNGTLRHALSPTGDASTGGGSSWSGGSTGSGW